MGKIYFIVLQIVIIRMFLEIDNCGFYKRVIARLIIIRIQDFINHIRRYNNSNISDQGIKREIKNQVNALSELYNEFLLLQRNKLSGHIQDLDFIDRMNSWLNIDFEKSDFFEKNILYIYELLNNENDYKAISNSFYLKAIDISEIKKINAKYDLENAPRMSSDIFSITRFNSGGLIPGTATQDRIAVLMGLKLIIDYEIELFENVNLPSLRETFLILLLVDIINYLDNLFTRNVSANAPQAMDGLDQILNNSRATEAAIRLSKFKNIFDIENNFKNYRELRNKIGGHIDTAISLNDSLNDLRNIDIKELKDRFHKIEDALTYACDSEFYLKSLLLPPTKLNGVIGMSMQPEKAFDSTSVPVQDFKDDFGDINDTDEYNKQIMNLLTHKSSFEDVRSYFYRAFESSEVVDSVNFNNKKIDIRKAHDHLIEKITKSEDTNEILTILQILNQCKNGYPKQLEYILYRTLLKSKSNDLLYLNYIFQFGEIANNQNQEIIHFLTQGLKNEKFHIRYQSLLSIWKIEIRTQGIECINKKRIPTKNEFYNITIECINSLNPFEKYVTLVLLTSEINCNPIILTYKNVYNNLYIKVFFEEFIANLSFLGNYLGIEITQDIAEQIISNMERDIYTSVFLILAEELDKNKLYTKANFLYKLISNGILKLNYNFEPFVIHLGFSHSKIKRYIEAENVFKRLIRRDPTKMEYYIYLLSLYSEIKDKEKYIKTKKEMMSMFSIPSNIEDFMREIESEMFIGDA